MAKFLPFVVEKSTPIHVFQTLVTRSKGLNDVLVASIFYLVVDKGITEVRKAASEFPEMDQDKLYEQLINVYPTYRISNEQFTKMQLMKEHIELWYPEKISKELLEYSFSDIMTFLLVMILTKHLKDYTSLKLNKIFTDEAEVKENSLIALNLFSDDGDEYYFSSKDDLRAYVWCHGLIAPRKKNVEAVKAVYYPTKGSKTRPPNAKRSKKKAKPKTAGSSYTEAKKAYTPPSPSQPSTPSPTPNKTRFGQPPQEARPKDGYDMPYDKAGQAPEAKRVPFPDNTDESWADKLPSWDDKLPQVPKEPEEPRTDWPDGQDKHPEEDS